MSNQYVVPELSFKERVDLLAAFLDRVDRWLWYAESKNGILLTLASAAMGVALRIGTEGQLGFSFVMYWLGILLCLVAVIRLIVAFWPKLDLLLENFRSQWRIRERALVKSPNLMYFGHIAGLAKTDFQKKLGKRLGKSWEELSQLERDFIEQIYINAGIAHRKFQAFGPAAAFFAAGIALIVLDLFASG